MNKFKVICLILGAFTVFNFVSAFNKVSTASANLSQNTVILDVGHGGEDGGAVGIGGVLEKDINLDIALKLADILKNSNYKVIMTRDSDIDLADESLVSINERKKSDMHKRLAIINENDAELVVSIHQNFFEQSQYKGAQIFYANDDSKALAELIQTHIVQSLQTDNNRLAKLADNKFLLNNSNKPMVIAECGFISNAEDCENLQKGDYQESIAQAIFEAIDDYLS